MGLSTGSIVDGPASYMIRDGLPEGGDSLSGGATD